MGTDAGTPFCEHGKAYVDELRLMTVGGYTAEQALLAGTKISAEVLGIEADYGTLEPGKHADFLVLQENPLENIETLRNICEVYQFGNKVKRQYYC